MKIFLIALFAACSMYGANHYVSQSGGTFSGGSACNGQSTESIATFNGATPSAGETDTLCGTITTTLQINASGTSGNPITILADSGASIQVGGGSGNAIVLNNNTYLVFDGGFACGPGVSMSTCGQLAITNNGSPQGGFATNDLAGLFGGNCTSTGSIEIRNWQLGPVYQHTSPLDNTPNIDTQTTILFANNTTGQACNLSIHDNTIHDVGVAYFNENFTNTPTVLIYNNYIYNIDWAMGLTPDSGTSAFTLLFHDNHIGSTTNWDTTPSSGSVTTNGTAVTWSGGTQFNLRWTGGWEINNQGYLIASVNSPTSITLATSAGVQSSPVPYSIGDTYHHDGIHNFSGYLDMATSYQVYNNLFDGEWGNCCATAFIYTEYGLLNNYLQFNNVFNQTAGDLFPLVQIVTSGTSGVYNDTYICGGSPSYNVVALGIETGTTGTFNVENNAFLGCGSFYTPQGPPYFVTSNSNFNYNYYMAQGGTGNYAWGNQNPPISNWQSICSCDSHSGYNATNFLNSNGSPQATFPGIGAGVNLTSLAITPLNSSTTAGKSATSTSRPSSGAWTIGAYNYASATYSGSSIVGPFRIIGNVPLYAGWSAKGTVTFPAASGSSTLTNFTVAFTGSNSKFATIANGGLVKHTVTRAGVTVPADFALTTDSTCAVITGYTWGIETYDPVGGSIIGWALLSSLTSSASVTPTVCVGNALVSTYQGGAQGAEFDSNTSAAWHLGDNAASTVVEDSSANSVNLTNTINTSSAHSAGVIDGSLSYSGSASQSSVSPTTIGNSPVTIGGWFNSTDTSNYAIIMSYDDGTGSAGYRIQITAGGGPLTFTVPGVSDYATGLTPVINTWYFFRAAISTGTIVFYYAAQGGSIASNTISIGSMVGTPNALRLGAAGAGSSFAFVGFLDEFKMASVLRSTDWIATEYANQSSPPSISTLVAISGSTSQSFIF